MRRAGLCIDYVGKEIAPAQFVRHNYIEFVEEAGLLPFVIPITSRQRLIRESVREADVVIITGGGPGTNMRFAKCSLRRQNPKRYDFERAVIREAARSGKPIIGICRGAQMVAEVMGGRVSNLSKECIERHNRRRFTNRHIHKARLMEDTYLRNAMGADQISVYSLHQQAVELLPQGFRISARAVDGVIEAFESVNKKGRIVCMQFHPERLCRKNKAFLNILKKIR